jgi:hypothetical protein
MRAGSLDSGEEPSFEEKLRAAPMAELLHISSTPAASSLVDHLAGITLGRETRERERSAESTKSFKETIGALARDLLFAAAFARSGGYCFRPERSPAFTNTVAAYRQYLPVRDAWRSEGLLEWLPGIRHGNKFEETFVAFSGKAVGRSPRLRATAKLLAIAGSHGITPENVAEHFERRHDLGSPVALSRGSGSPKWRGAPKASVRFQDTEHAKAIAAEVRTINAFLAEQAFEPTIEPYLRAIFSEDSSRPGKLVWGGRLYATGEGNYQSWSKAQRMALRINEESVAEIDIKASHLTILQAHYGIQIPKGEDPYSVPGIPRTVVKKLVTVILGKGNLGITRWPQGLAADYKQETGRVLGKDFKLKETLGRVTEAIYVLQRVPIGSLGWGDLQLIEANVIRSTMLRLSSIGVVSLPIHDSLLVPLRHVEVSTQILKDTFNEATKVEPSIEVSRRAIDTWRGNLEHICTR